MGWGSFDDDEDDPRVLREAANGARQARRAFELVRTGLASADGFHLEPATIVELQGLAMDGLIDSAGQLRDRSDIEISGSKHMLPPHEDVATLLDDACAFVNAHPRADPLFVASYILWRICWIHPFDDGNGRTARAVSYLVLSVRLGRELTGEKPIPSRMKHAPRTYHRALEAADDAWKDGRVDVSALQSLLRFYLMAQLRNDPITLPPGLTFDDE